MNDNSTADKVNKWQILIENIRELVPEIPGADPWYTEVKQNVESFRSTEEKLQMLRAQLLDAVVIRNQQGKEALQSIRRLAATARAHFGFANPLLETFNIRSEHRARRGSKASAKKNTPQQTS
ncbi:MAG: hypothetical protein ABJC13_18480 [Acidobacteriota bacterium]